MTKAEFFIGHYGLALFPYTAVSLKTVLNTERDYG